MRYWLIFLERIINGIKVDEETMYIQANTFVGASVKVMEYFIDEGWEVINAQEQVA